MTPLDVDFMSPFRGKLVFHSLPTLFSVSGVFGTSVHVS